MQKYYNFYSDERINYEYTKLMEKKIEHFILNKEDDLEHLKTLVESWVLSKCTREQMEEYYDADQIIENLKLKGIYISK